MKNEIKNWYNGLTEKEVGKLKSALENRMMFNDSNETEDAWNNLLEQKYNEYLKEIESNKAKQEAELKNQEELESKQQYAKEIGVVTLELYVSGKYNAWAAEINGIDEKFGLSRKFINPFETTQNRKTYLLKEGKCYNYLSDNEQHYAQVIDYKLVEMSKLEMVELIKNI